MSNRKMQPMVVLLSVCAIALAEAQRSTNTAAIKHDIFATNGKIYSPGYPSCDSEDQPVVFWNFTSSSDLIVLKFIDFDLPRCSTAKIVLTLSAETESYCGAIKPPSVIWGDKISITFYSFTKNCGRGFAVMYASPRVVIHLPTPVIVGQPVDVTVEVPYLPSEIHKVCHKEVAGGRKTLKLESQPMIEQFAKLGMTKYYVECQLREEETYASLGRINNMIDVDVQDDLQLIPTLDILKNNGCNNLEKEVSITIQHRFTYPVTYHVFLVNNPNQVISKTMEYTEDQMDQRPSMKTILKLPWFTELEPGKYKSTLIVENDVSSQKQTFTLNMCEHLTSIYILTIQYIDLAPSIFTVKVQIPKGSPAEIDISLRNKQDNKNATTARKFCNNPQECQEVTIQMSVPFEGVFDIIAMAKNELGEVTSTIGPVESFPMVEDVFVTSSFPINTITPGIFIVFYKIPSNRGTFEIKLSANDQVFSTEKLSVHTAFKKAKQTLPNMQIPFDPTTYKVHKKSHLLSKPGKYEVTVKVETENHKQSLTAKTVVEVFSALVEICLMGVKIQDGREGRFLTQSFDGRAPILLTADVKMDCDIKDGDRIGYIWKIYKAQGLAETPDLKNEIHVDNLKTDTFELYLEPSKIKAGLYLFELLVSHKDNNGEVMAHVDDFASVEIPKLKLNAQVCGGAKREISHNTTGIELNAVCSGNQRITGIKYDWFCALSKEDLPAQKHIGMFQKKGACFKQKLLFVGENQKFQLNIENITRRDSFQVRVFLSLEGYEAVFADQEIVLLTHPAPSIVLKCFANCENEVKPEHTLSVLALCNSCFKYEWYYEDKLQCNRPFCTIKDTDMPSTGSVKLRAVGFGKSGQNATVYFERKIAAALQMTFKVYPKEPIPNKSKVTFSYETDETVLVAFSIAKTLRDPFTLLQYGYNQAISDVYISAQFSSIIFKLEACTLNGICSATERAVKVDLTDTEQNLDATEWESNLEKAVKSGNTQKVVKNALAISGASEMQNENKKVVFDYGLKSPMISSESAKQSLDLLRLGIPSPDELTRPVQRNLVKRLSNISSVIRYDEDISSFMLNTVVRNSIHLASTIFESTKESKMDSDPNQRALTNVLADISWDNLRERYSTCARTYSSDAITVSMKRHWREDAMLVSDGEVSVQVNSTEDKDMEFADIMVFRFKSSETKFETKTGSPDEVVGMSFINNHKILGETKPRTEQFTPNKPVKFSLKTHRKEPEYSIVELTAIEDDSPDLGTESILGGTTLKSWIGNRAIIIQEEREPVLLKIHMILSNVSEEIIQELSYIKLELQETSYDSPFTKIIYPSDLEDRKYTWMVPVAAGDSFFNLTIQIRSSIPIYSLKILPHAFRCSFWNDDTNDWSSRGCMVDPATMIDTWDRCECDLQRAITSRSVTSKSVMKLFSSRLVIYPNKIDTSKLNEILTPEKPANSSKSNFTLVIVNFKREVNENPIIVVTVISMYVVFTFAFVFARIKDSKDKEMPSYKEVCDNMPNERYRYLVTVFTGSRRRAGPTSTVAIKLIGNIGSVVHLLQKFGEEIVLFQGSVVTFLVTARSCLGDVNSVRIWHCNNGDSPEWYLDRLVVRDYEANECWFFLVNTWLSDYHMGECQIDITVKAASISQLHSFHSLFTIKSQNYLKDRHLWYSMFAMRPWSIYDMTRTQRVACCMLLIFMLMLTSLMFYGSDSAFVVDLGFYSFKWSNIAIGMESGALCFPVTYIVTLIFRSSREHNRRYPTHMSISSYSFKTDSYIEEEEPAIPRANRPESQKTSVKSIVSSLYFSCEELLRSKLPKKRKRRGKHREERYAFLTLKEKEQGQHQKSQRSSEKKSSPYRKSSSSYFSCIESNEKLGKKNIPTLFNQNDQSVMSSRKEQYVLPLTISDSSFGAIHSSQVTKKLVTSQNAEIMSPKLRKHHRVNLRRGRKKVISRHKNPQPSRCPATSKTMLLPRVASSQSGIYSKLESYIESVRRKEESKVQEEIYSKLESEEQQEEQILPPKADERMSVPVTSKMHLLARPAFSHTGIYSKLESYIENLRRKEESRSMVSDSVKSHENSRRNRLSTSQTLLIPKVTSHDPGKHSKFKSSIRSKFKDSLNALEDNFSNFSATPEGHQPQIMASSHTEIDTKSKTLRHKEEIDSVPQDSGIVLEDSCKNPPPKPDGQQPLRISSSSGLIYSKLDAFVERLQHEEKIQPKGQDYVSTQQDSLSNVDITDPDITEKEQPLDSTYTSVGIYSKLDSFPYTTDKQQPPKETSASVGIYSKLDSYVEKLKHKKEVESGAQMLDEMGEKPKFCEKKALFHSKQEERTSLMPSAGIYDVSFLPAGFQGGSRRRPSPAMKAGVTVMDVDPGSIDYKPLPWFFIYFAWLIVFFVVAMCSALSILYGMTYGVHISRQWVVSLLTGVIQSVFVLEPLKAIMLAYFIVANNPRHDITDWIPPLRTEVLPHKHENGTKVLLTLRKERELNPAYKPPNVEKVRQASLEQMMQRVQKRRLKDMSVHLIYLILLCVIAFGLHDNRIFYFKQSLTNMFKVNTKAWNSINTQENVYDWFKGPVIETLYGGYSSYFTDGQLLVIAPPTLRQQRIVKSDPCLHSYVVPYFNLPTCKSGYEDDEKGKFSAKWNKFSRNLNGDDDNKSPWEYQPGDLWSLPFLGEHDNYHLGGFVAQLSSDKNNATKMLEYLGKNNWIDEQTRIVMMETVLYNSAVRFYCVVTMAFEIPNTGKIHPSLQLMVMKSHYVVTNTDVVIYLSLFGLLGMVFYFVYNIVSLARETGIEYLADVWNVLEILTLLTSVGAVVTYLSKAMYTDLALYAMKTGGENLFLFYTAACLDYTLTCLFGYCMFFTMMRTVALMEGHPHFRLAHATMQIMRIDLAGHLFCLLVGYLAFCHSGLILFHDMLDFSSKLRATQSIVAYAAGAYMNNLLANHPMHGGIFLLIFLLLYVKLFVNLYAVILENAFRESKLLLRNIKRGDFVTLRRKQIRSLFAIEAMKKAEQEAKEKEEQEETEQKIVLELLKVKKEREAIQKKEGSVVQLIGGERGGASELVADEKERTARKEERTEDESLLMCDEKERIAKEKATVRKSAKERSGRKRKKRVGKTGNQEKVEMRE